MAFSTVNQPISVCSSFCIRGPGPRHGGFIAAVEGIGAGGAAGVVDGRRQADFHTSIGKPSS